MTEFRSFLNTDPPALIEIWQKQNPFRCFSQVLSRKLLEQTVLAKPYFDPQGLIIAFDDGIPVGFVHVGFAPSDDLMCVDFRVGILSMLRVVDGENKSKTISGLWERARKYLLSKGAKTCFAGGRFPRAPFYTGLYGGSRIPGIPVEDVDTTRILAEIGFQNGEAIDVMQLNLKGYRPKVSRTQMAVRRKFQVSAIVDPLSPNWWESCTFGWAELVGFRVFKRADQELVGSVVFWEIQPLSSQWGKSTMGLVDLLIQPEYQKQGLATFLVSESLRHLASQGIACVEIQIRRTDERVMGMANKIGFERISEGRQMKFQLVET